MTQCVLLAEDEPNIVESLRFLLGRAGFDVRVCDTGTKAIELAQSVVPDVMILDVMLPGMDGFEVLSRVRASTALSHVKVMMLTAKGQREDRERALQSGADQFMSKPFGNAELLETVKALADSARSVGQATEEPGQVRTQAG